MLLIGLSSSRSGTSGFVGLDFRCTVRLSRYLSTGGAQSASPFLRAASRAPRPWIAVEKEQPLVPMDGQAAWIGNAAVLAKGTERPAIAIEGQKRAIAVAIGTGRARDQERHLNPLS